LNEPFDPTRVRWVTELSKLRRFDARFDLIPSGWVINLLQVDPHRGPEDPIPARRALNIVEVFRDESK